jgi:hypothetical protein
MTSYVLEGEWTGYTASQQHVVHREVITAKRAKAMKVNCIVYTDGTSLLLRLRERKPREKVREIHGYDSLIRQAERTGRTRVLVADEDMK